MTDAPPEQPVFGTIRHIHMVGIGGIGMSSIADVLLQWGFTVTGSDLSDSEILDDLRERGASISIGHDADQIGDADVVVHTSAVDPEDNPETKAAARRQLPVIDRARMLAAMTRRKFGVAVAGTHGKTTTTTLAGHVVRAGRLDPTIIVGGRVDGFEQNNAVAGDGDVVVLEADEFDRTFLQLHPDLAVLTNIEWEHVDIYDDLEATRRAFAQFANKVPFYGAVIACIDDPQVSQILPRIQPRVITYGTDPEARLRGVDIRRDGFTTRFGVVLDGDRLGEISLRAPGLHNVQNALASVAIGLELRIPFDNIRQGLADYSGVFRRFHRRGEVDDVLVIDDYAHHPTEVRATIEAARSGWDDRRLVAVFQPHLYSRTQKFHRQFGQALAESDVVVVTDVYPAREEPIAGVDGTLIVESARDCGHDEVVYVEDRDDLPDRLAELTHPGDLVATMGAGDITDVGEQLLEKLRR